ncbi:hypothetical protein PGT21_008191 [Puccinia graminis f. sp. tritici]|uniref:Uncharacterized protein n=1 Tax=Puccinia graminis f. sp. tritici TaxID=56615 RepID=A0A5B0Q9Z3_PUCGR|nr:hypothetical protein PGT21_008191 [Puccinia graminis f. sp. tritici]
MMCNKAGEGGDGSDPFRKKNGLDDRKESLLVIKTRLPPSPTGQEGFPGVIETFSTGSPRAATAGGRTRTRQSTGFRGLHRLVHGCIARLSRGAHEEACRAAVKESAAALKRSAHGVELRQRTQAKHPGECLTAGPQGVGNDPSFRDQIGSELSGPTSVGPGCKWIEGRPSWNQRGRRAHVLPTKSNLVLWNHRQKKRSPRETDDEIGLTEHLQSRSRGFHGVGVSRGIHIPARQEAPLGCS